jgi:hypothetical protein
MVKFLFDILSLIFDGILGGNPLLITLFIWGIILVCFFFGLIEIGLAQ